MKKLIFAISVFFTSCVLASDIKPIPLVGVKSESAEYSAICSSVKKYCAKNSQTKILKNKSNSNEIFLITSSQVFVKINGGERYSISQVWNSSIKINVKNKFYFLYRALIMLVLILFPEAR